MREDNVFSHVCLSAYGVPNFPLPRVVQTCSLGDSLLQSWVPPITIQDPPPKQVGKWAIARQLKGLLVSYCFSTEWQR